MEQLTPIETNDARNGGRLALTIIGLLLLLGGILWAAPIVAFYLIKGDVREYLDPLVQVTAPQMRLIIGTVLISPLPLFVFGIGLLVQANWARLGAMVFLGVQLIGILVALHFATHGFSFMGGTVLLMDNLRTGYTSAAACVVVSAALIITLWRANPAR